MTATQPPDLHTLTALRVHNLPPGWRILSVRSQPGYGLELWGAVPIGTISRGPRKGQPKWPPQREWWDVVITIEEVQETRLQWEAETGICSHCGGSGQQVKSISVTKGASYRTCSGCHGTGRAGEGQ